MQDAQERFWLLGLQVLRNLHPVLYDLIFSVSACSASCPTFIWDDLLLSKYRMTFFFLLHYLNIAGWVLECFLKKH